MAQSVAVPRRLTIRSTGSVTRTASETARPAGRSSSTTQPATRRTRSTRCAWGSSRSRRRMTSAGLTSKWLLSVTDDPAAALSKSVDMNGNASSNSGLGWRADAEFCPARGSVHLDRRRQAGGATVSSAWASRCSRSSAPDRSAYGRACLDVHAPAMSRRCRQTAPASIPATPSLATSAATTQWGLVAGGSSHSTRRFSSCQHAVPNVHGQSN